MCTPSSCSRLALALALLALAGCPREKEDAETYAARNAVVRYNQALVETFGAAKAELLASAATSDEVSRVASVISGLAARGQFMVARQTAFEVLRVVIGPVDAGLRRATVEVDESWTYEHRSLEARERPVTPKTLRYRLLYTLERQGDRWLVSEAAEKSATGGASP